MFVRKTTLIFKTDIIESECTFNYTFLVLTVEIATILCISVSNCKFGDLALAIKILSKKTH